MPQVVYLHGCTVIGYCNACKTKGHISTQCSKCGNKFKRSKILFPIKEKNYNYDPLLKGEWQSLKTYLEKAYIITIFGYSAPKTDVEAVNMMLNAWGPAEKRRLEEVEIIDIKNRDSLVNTWKNFIHSHHFRISDSYFNSWTAKHPRRTCELMWQQLMMCTITYDNTPPQNTSLRQLQNWYKHLLDNE